MDDAASLLERSQWDFFWVPEDTVVVDRPELAFLSSARPHLNRVYRVRAAADRLPALVDEVSTAHLGGSHFYLADTIDLAPLERVLERAGYHTPVEHIASVIDVGVFRARATSSVRVERVTTLAQLRDAVAVMDEVFGETPPASDAVLAEMLRQCVGEAPRTWRFVAYDHDDRPVSYGAVTLYPELGFGLMWGGSTITSARGRGAYSATVSARIAAAASAGINSVGLYAKIDTAAPIVARQGFRDVGRMWQWSRA